MNDVPSFLISGIPRGMVETFARLAMGGSSDAGGLVDEMMADGVGAEELMLDLLAPAARLMGEMWCNDEANFLDVTLGLSRIQHMMRQVRLPAVGVPAERGVALLVPVPGEQHVLGLRMIEEFLIRDGWSVRLGAPAEQAALGHLVAAEGYDFVGFSISGTRLLPVLAASIATVRAQTRNPDVRIMVGGVAVTRENPIAFPPGVDAVVGDAQQAVAQARRWQALAGALT